MITVSIVAIVLIIINFIAIRLLIEIFQDFTDYDRLIAKFCLATKSRRIALLIPPIAILATILSIVRGIVVLFKDVITTFINDSI